jgi:hypothetical protein
MKYACLSRLIAAGLVLVTSLSLNSYSSQAQQPEQWSPQARIPVYGDLTGEQPPILIADQNRIVHAFNSQEIEDGLQAVVYRQWTPEQGWTHPIDVQLNPNRGAIEVLDVYLDRAGIMHMAVEMDSQVYYAQAPGANAGQAQAWTEPRLVGEHVSPPFRATLAGDERGNLVILYGGSGSGKGLYAISSSDTGHSWSTPEPISLTYDDNVSVVEIRVWMGRSGQLHAVWNVADRLANGVSGHYARLDVERRQWTDPIPLDSVEEGGLLSLGIHFPSVVEYEDDLIVAYYHGNVNGLWWRRSRDGGQSWSDPVRVSPRHVGTNGGLSFVIDSNNTLHAFFGGRVDDNNHGMWHTVWQGGGWSEARPVVRGPQVRDHIGGQGFDPKAAEAVISQGNLALVGWITDGIAGENGAWFSYSILDAPEVPVVPGSTPPTTPTASPEATASTPEGPRGTPISGDPLPFPTQTTSGSYQDDGLDAPSSNTTLPFMVGLAPVVMLILVVTARRLRLLRRD